MSGWVPECPSIVPGCSEAVELPSGMESPQTGGVHTSFLTAPGEDPAHSSGPPPPGGGAPEVGHRGLCWLEVYTHNPYAELLKLFLL